MTGTVNILNKSILYIHTQYAYLKYAYQHIKLSFSCIARKTIKYNKPMKVEQNSLVDFIHL